jgi:hypothetical protein
LVPSRIDSTSEKKNSSTENKNYELKVGIKIRDELTIQKLDIGKIFKSHILKNED